MEDREKLEQVVEAVRELRAQAGLQDNQASKLPEFKTLNSIKASIYKLYDDYQLPLCDSISFSEQATLIIARLRRQAQERKAFQEANGEEFFDATEDLRYQKNIIRTEGEITRGYDFFEKKYFSRPLKYQKEVSLDNFETELEMYLNNGGSEKIVSLPGSISKLIKASEKRGLSLDQVSELLFQFIQKYQQDLISSAIKIRSENNAFAMLQLLVERIDCDEEKNRIISCKSSVYREVGENVSVVLSKIKSLNHQLLSITNPSMEASRLESKAEEITITEVENFVSAPAFVKYKRYCRDKLTDGEQVTFKKTIRKLQSIEQDPACQITARKGMKTTVDPIVLASANTGGSVDVNYVSTPRMGARGRTEQRGRQNQRGGMQDRTQRKSSFNGSSSPNSFSKSPSFSRSNTPRYSSGSRPSSRPLSRSSSASKYDQNNLKGNESPKSYLRKANNSVKVKNVKDMPDRCYRCYSNNHFARSCFRFLETSKYPCQNCIKTKGIKLFHPTQYCRFKKSNYRSPSNDTRLKRNNYFEKKGYKKPEKN